MKKRAIITIDYNIPNGTIEEIAKKHDTHIRFIYKTIVYKNKQWDVFQIKIKMSVSL